MIAVSVLSRVERISRIEIKGQLPEVRDMITIPIGQNAERRDRAGKACPNEVRHHHTIRTRVSRLCVQESELAAIQDEGVEPGVLELNKFQLISGPATF